MPNCCGVSFLYHTTNGEVKPRHLSSRRLASFENVDVSLVPVGELHNRIAIESVRGFIRISPPRKIAECGKTLRGRGARICTVVCHQKSGRKYCRTRTPRIRDRLPRAAGKPVFIEHPGRWDELRRTHRAAKPAALGTRHDLRKWVET